MTQRREMLKLEVKYKVVVMDRSGKVVKKVEGTCKTGTAWLSRLLSMIFPRGDVEDVRSVLDWGGTSRTLRYPYVPATLPPPNYNPYMWDVGAGKMIQVGIGESDLAFDREQYNLISPIAWVGYSTYTFTDDGTKVIVTVTGSWYNDTGATVTVKEIGLNAWFRDWDGTEFRVMLVRDVITPTTVDPTYTIAVGYEVTIPF